MDPPCQRSIESFELMALGFVSLSIATYVPATTVSTPFSSAPVPVDSMAATPLLSSSAPPCDSLPKGEEGTVE